MALKNPRIRFTVVPPNDKPFERKSEVSGYVTDRAKLVDLLLHPWPKGSRITNLRAVDADGKDLAEQPEELREASPAPAPEQSAPVAPPTAE